VGGWGSWLRVRELGQRSGGNVPGRYPFRTVPRDPRNTVSVQSSCAFQALSGCHVGGASVHRGRAPSPTDKRRGAALPRPSIRFRGHESLQCAASAVQCLLTEPGRSPYSCLPSTAPSISPTPYLQPLRLTISRKKPVFLGGGSCICPTSGPGPGADKARGASGVSGLG